MTIYDARLIEVVRRHFDIHFIADGDPNEIFPHFPGNVRKDFMSVGQGDAKHGAGKHLRYISCQFDWLFFRHKKIEPPNVAIGGGKINYF
jgi:hypothetical protein